MNKFELYIFLVQLVHVLTGDVVSYKNSKLDISKEHKKLLMLMESHEIDALNRPYVLKSYLVPKPEEKYFQRSLIRAGADFNVLVDDLEEEILKEKKSYENARRKYFFSGSDICENYYSYGEMVSFLQGIIKVKNPYSGEPLAVIEPIGKSYQGRSVHLVKISLDHSAQKPVVFLEAGMHAREWTSPAAALYLIYQLVANFTRTSNALIDVDYYIVPLSNPDGYEYSRNSDRLWRKTRSLFRGHYGVDGNRNFDYHWGETGSSIYPESEIFQGPQPFSEPETRNIRDAGKKYLKKIVAFISIHAYGPNIVYPWSYKKMGAPQSEVMDKIAQEVAKAIERYNGTRYRYGVASILMYEASGGSDDYFKGVLGVDLSFTVELSSAKRMSFIVPADDIQGIVAEAFEGFKTIASGAVKFKFHPPEENWKVSVHFHNDKECKKKLGSVYFNSRSDFCKNYRKTCGK